jgi:hypothetical protein
MINFDYIYYRLTKFYFKWDGSTGITAVIGVSMIQTLLLADVTIVMIRLIWEGADYKPYSKVIANSFVAILFLFIIINNWKYNGNYDKFCLLWKHESRNIKLVKGLLVIFSLILPWVPIFLIGMYWK